MLPTTGCAPQRLGRGHFPDHARHLAAHHFAQFNGAAAEGELHAAHDVGAVLHLRVERRPHPQDVGGAQIQQLRHDGGGPDIHGHAVAGPRRKGERRIVSQDGGFPLRDLERDVGLGIRVARQPPPVRKFR